jgi:hypothetical protein
MKKVLLLGVVGAAIGFGATQVTFKTQKEILMERDLQGIKALKAHYECVRRANSFADLQRCNFQLYKSRLVWGLKKRIELAKARNGGKPLPKWENYLKCIEKATNRQELRKCRIK